MIYFRVSCTVSCSIVIHFDNVDFPSFSFILLAAPRFAVSEEKRRRNVIVLPVGNTIRMDCSATGYPKPTIKWYKDKALYQGGNGSSKFNRGTFQTVLIIRNAVPADRGLYTCNVSNAYGWISNSYRVHVRNHGKGM